MIAQELKSNKNKTVNGPLLLIPQIYSDQRGLFLRVGIKKNLTR